jgi:hypothetical protein
LDFGFLLEALAAAPLAQKKKGRVQLPAGYETRGGTFFVPKLRVAPRVMVSYLSAAWAKSRALTLCIRGPAVRPGPKPARKTRAVWTAKDVLIRLSRAFVLSDRETNSAGSLSILGKAEIASVMP